MAQPATIPEYIDDVDTEELPVEVYSDRQLQIWHDERKEYCSAEGEDPDVVISGENPQIIEESKYEGTLRITELVPVSRKEDE